MYSLYPFSDVLIRLIHCAVRIFRLVEGITYQSLLFFGSTAVIRRVVWAIWLRLRLFC